MTVRTSPEPQPEPRHLPNEGMHLTEVDRNGLEVLDRAECLRLLKRSTLGRVAISTGALPVILPVNFGLVDEVVVFRTSAGTKLAAATQEAVVAFEVDDIEPFSHSGWSVLVTGVARTVRSPRRIAELSLARIPRWAPAGGDQLVEVPTEVISGRRIVPGLLNLVGRATPAPSR